MKRRTSQDWLVLIETWERSGLTQKEFCIQQSIAYSGFHYWFKKYKEDKTLSPSDSGFIPVKITSGRSKHRLPNPVSVEVVMPDGRRVSFPHGVEIEFLKALLA